MRVEISRKFQKQVNSCKDARIRRRVFFIIDAISKADSLKNIPHLKKLKNSDRAFSIRISDYRTGIKQETDCIIFAAFDHRSSIYKYFP
jgi:mRNA interferase RelE/StbE